MNLKAASLNCPFFSTMFSISCGSHSPLLPFGITGVSWEAGSPGYAAERLRVSALPDEAGIFSATPRGESRDAAEEQSFLPFFGRFSKFQR